MDRSKTPGVDMTTGSLGQGASTAIGLAYACRINKTNQFTYLILGDGECNEGQVWEAAAFSAHNHLDHLILFVDKNKKQADGQTKDICDMDNLQEKFKVFGFCVQETDGHDVEKILGAIKKAQQCCGKPQAIILDTTKGKGIREIEEMPNCHSISISENELQKYMASLDEQMNALQLS